MELRECRIFILLDLINPATIAVITVTTIFLNVITHLVQIQSRKVENTGRY